MAPQQSSTNASRNAAPASETAPAVGSGSTIPEHSHRRRSPKCDKERCGPPHRKASRIDPKAVFREKSLGLPPGIGEFAHNRRSIVGEPIVHDDHFHILGGQPLLEHAYESPAR